ncbi:MAG: FAD:protein FMN transferase, partial [Bacillota bacterium]
VEVSPEALYVTEQAVEFAELTEGSFDPTIAPLVDLWGFLGQEYRLPELQELERKIPFVDYADLEIDRDHSELFLPREQMGLELGGIAKGFIVDQALQVLEQAGVKHAFINAGGDIGLLGSKPGGEPWRVGISDPRETERIIAVLSIDSCSVVTSGDYERSFVEGGEKYHHILDPETGMPADELASVTVVADTTLTADVLSTAVFVLGPQRGLQLLDDLDEAEGVLITPELEVLVSSGLEDKIEIAEQ